MPEKELALEYLHYGYSAYKDRVEYLDTLRRDDVQDRLDLFVESIADLQARLTAHIASILSISQMDQTDSRVEFQKMATGDEIFKSMEALIRLFCDDVEPILNFRVLIYEECEVLPENTKFAESFSNNEKFSGTLKLRQRPGNRASSIHIPVSAAYETSFLLPGAPEAFSRNRYTCIDPKNIEFNSAIAPQVVDAVQLYFSQPIFHDINSVTCIPLSSPGGDAPIGVLSIESSLKHLIGDFGELELVIRTLQPFVFMIARIA